jgi:ribosomal protein L23
LLIIKKPTKTNKTIMTKDNYLIFTVNGGAGKNVLATAVVKAIKNAKPESKIIVITAYKEVWMYNPNVYRTYAFGNTPNFYKDYIQDKDNVEILNLEPYSTNDYILKKKNLIEIWCDLVGVPYNNEKPEIFFNQREIEFAENKYALRESPIMLIQTNGGSPQDMKVSWMRDMPLSNAYEIVQHFANNQKVVQKYGKNFRIIQIRRDDQPALNGVEQFKGNLRELMVLIKYSEKRIFIDSVCQHIAAALDKPSTVLWIRNTPKVLGYEIHDNIVTKAEDEIDTLSDSFLEPYDIQGNVYQCPFKEGTAIFDSQDLIDSLVKQNSVEINKKQVVTIKKQKK